MKVLIQYRLNSLFQNWKRLELLHIKQDIYFVIIIILRDMVYHVDIYGMLYQSLHNMMNLVIMMYQLDIGVTTYIIVLQKNCGKW